MLGPSWVKLAQLTTVGGSSANTNILYTAFKGWSLTLNRLQKLSSPAGFFRGALTRELEFARVVVHEPRDEGKWVDTEDMKLYIGLTLQSSSNVS